MRKLAAKHNMVIVVPVYEEQMPGLYFNTAAVIDADGKYLGKYRKHHIPHVHPGFWEKFYFTPGDGGYPVFETKYARVGVYICYDRHFPEGARVLGLNGAEIVLIHLPRSPDFQSTCGNSNNRRTRRRTDTSLAPLIASGARSHGTLANFTARVIFAIRAEIFAQASRDKDEVLVADLDLGMIEEVRRIWQFYRDRRPETYGAITTQSGKAAAAD